ncbi:DUF805 domain-containing protein [soil metagenome]
MTFGQKLFSFQGRMRRQDFWICTLVLWAASVVGGIILFAVFGGGMMSALTSASQGDPNDPAVVAALVSSVMPFYVACFALSVVFLWPNLAVSVKRLHDRGQSGWMVLICIIPFAGFFFWLINMGILDGTPGPNQFGPSPKGLGDDDGMIMA